MGQKQCYFKKGGVQCVALETKQHPLAVATDGRSYCKDHLCNVCFERPNGFGYGEDYCKQHVCANVKPNGTKCGCPREHLSLEFCINCWGEIMMEKSTSFVRARAAAISWIPTVEQEKVINITGNVLSLESELTNKVTSMIKLNGISAASFAKDIGDTFSNEIEGAVTTTKMSKASAVDAKQYKEVSYFYSGSVRCGDVPVKLFVALHTVVYNVQKKSTHSEEDEKNIQLDAGQLSASLNFSDGTKHSKDLCFATCSGRLVVKSFEDVAAAFEAQPDMAADA